MNTKITDGISYRTLAKSDGPLIAELLRDSPDTGAINFAPHYLIDPIEAYNHNLSDYIGIIAEIPGKNRLVGMCLVMFQKTQYNGNIHDTAYINNLVVHPDYRMRGIASELVGKIIDQSYKIMGEDCVVWAAIQEGNTGSQRTVGKYLTEMSKRRLFTPSFKPIPEPNISAEEFIIRPIEQKDFQVVIENLNTFHQSWNFFQPDTVASFAEWIDETPLSERIRHYLIAEDESGNIVSGAGISEDFRIRELQITNMPNYLRYMNILLKYVPSTGVMRNIFVSKFWFLPGFERAGKKLWSMIRAGWSGKATSILISIDSASPLTPILKLKPWIPKTVLSILIQSLEKIDHERLLYL